MRTREGFRPQLMGADSSQDIKGTHLGGFIAKTAGAITVTGKDGMGTPGTVYVDAIPVAAGQFLRLPISLPVEGFTVTLSGGASGTLLV